MQLGPDVLERHTLENGLTVIVQPDHSLPLVAINLWYHVGSKNERPGRTGFAHLFEHMLFQGSENVDTNGHFAHVQRAGGVANGSTWYDRTNYYETLPSEHLELGLWLESDRMGFFLPALTQEKLDTQKSVVINERRQRVDNAPYGRGSERLNELLYPTDHPYSWPVIGYTDDIEASTLKQVEDFFSVYYTPNNAVLTLVGDVEPNAALDLVGKYFADIPRGPALAPLAEVEHQSHAATETLEDQVALTQSTWAKTIAGVGTEAWYRASLLTEVISGGRSSRLFRRLVQERQDAQSVGCYLMPTELCATFALQAVGKSEQSAESLSSAVQEVLKEIRDGGIEDYEYQRALNAIITSQYEELQAFDDRADAISMGHTYFDDPEFAFTEADTFKKISLDEVNGAAQELLDMSESTNVVIVPSSGAEESAVRNEEVTTH